MSSSSPSYYQQIPSNEALREANESVKKAEVSAVDILPFQALGGRRFEILTYLMLLDPPPPLGVTVSLVKASGDKGRDVVTHLHGRLRSVIQCKALDEPLTRPALIRELIKLAVFDSQEHFIPSSGIDYEVWAPGGLTEPAQKLIQEWPNSLKDSEAKDAFEANKSEYKTLTNVEWSYCADHLLIEFPLKTNLVSRDGLRLSLEVRNKPRLFAHFFQVNVVFNREDVKASLAEMGIRPEFDQDILRILKDIESFDKDKRIFLGPHVFGLSMQHYALMSKEELKLFMEAALKPYGVTHQILLSSLTRYVDKRAVELRDSVKFSSPNFPYLLVRVLHVRMVSRISRNLSLKTLNLRAGLNDDELELTECAERILTRFWDEFETVSAAYDPSCDAPGSDPEYRARIAAHARLGAASRAEFESQMRSDFEENLQAISMLDNEVLALVPERLMVLSDTILPFDNPQSLRLLFDNFHRIAELESSNKGESTQEEAVLRARGTPTLGKVTWSPVSYREGALFRGYSYALIFRGANFSMDAQIAYRRNGEQGQRDESNYFWRKPNLLVANYAEISTGGCQTESSLSWRGYEFCIRNSASERSEWVRFEYPFDYYALNQELDNAIYDGDRAREGGDFENAEAELRKAWVFADRLFGSSDQRAKQLFKKREKNLNDLMLSRLRYRVGDQVRILSGEQGGRSGIVRKLRLRHKFAYEIEDPVGALFSASDNQIE
jgi:hypothetical protein